MKRETLEPGFAEVGIADPWVEVWRGADARHDLLEFGKVICAQAGKSAFIQRNFIQMLGQCSAVKAIR